MKKKFVTSDGATLSYDDDGLGPPLILLPGWSQSAAMFRHQIAAFGGIRRVLALDFRGHGASPKAERGLRIARFATDVAELMAHEGLARVSLLGWSMGCSVAWAFIDQYGTSRLDRCVFVDEPASVMRQAGMSDEAAADAGALFDAAAVITLAADIAGPGGPATRAAFLGAMVTRTIAPDLKAWILAENLRADGEDMAALFVHHCSLDWRDIFGRVDVPTLVIGGHASHVATRSQRWIHDQIKGSELVLFDEKEGGAHFPFLEHPERFNAVVGRFLAGGNA